MSVAATVNIWMLTNVPDIILCTLQVHTQEIGTIIAPILQMGEISTEVLEEENDGLYGYYKGQQKKFPSKGRKEAKGTFIQT